MERQALSVKKVVIMGGGLSGLSASIRLASEGFSVTILEKNNRLGGKLQRITQDGYSFDHGPSTITMLDAFHSVFHSAGVRMEDYLTFYPVDPLTRNFFADGTRVDLVKDIDALAHQIASYSPEDALRLPAFMQEAQRYYHISKNQFLNRLFTSWKTKLSPALIMNMVKIHPLTSIQKRLNKYFSHPNTLALFGRYATYVGSSPFMAPAIFNMMAFLEAGEGIYGVKGGTYAIVEAYQKLALEKGVSLCHNTEVKKIRVVNGQVIGAETTEGIIDADIIVAAGDAMTVYQKLIPEKDRPSMSDKKIASFEPSLSGLSMLIGAAKTFPDLVHHNVFFPEKYEQEFSDLFDHKQPVSDPAIYICYSGYSEPDRAPAAKSNLFVLVNAPYLTKGMDWSAVKEDYTARIIKRLEERGLKDLNDSIEMKVTMTPDELEKGTGAYRGAIYGLSSNHAKQAFLRPSNRSADIKGLWFTGGSTHPGGGTPIVTRSGQLVAEAIIKEN